MLDTHPTPLARPARATPGPGHVAAVQVTNLSKSYGAVRAVDGLTMRIEPGEIAAVLGPNGAGKSTANEAILGLLQPDAGSVEVFGLDPRAAVRAGRVGAMLQSGALLADARVIDVLRLMAGLHANPLPLAEVVGRADLGAFLTTRTDRLSGGQAQRLRYALALLPDPDLLLLDEPTVGMDVETRRGFWRSMREFAAAGRTVLFATHYLEEADDVADRIVVLAGGRVVAEGTGDEIRSRVAGRTIALAALDATELDATVLDATDLARLPAVAAVERVGSRWHLHSTDSDRTLRELLRDERVYDVEVTAARLEDAFLALTAPPDTQQGATP
ncbi:ABC transporter ATP-binding protein [Agrococcus citreus]|uniref:ABC transporter ATP-binding protein n=1 Tax=Agrococcus citreus TaxID=84643 RepID=A0ABN1YSC9_9MICO